MAKIQIQALTISDWVDSTVTKIRIFSNYGFTASTFNFIPQGSFDSGTVYQELTCTFDGGLHTLTVPQFILDSTTDGVDFQNARYTAAFYDSLGRFVKPFIANFAVPPVIASVSGCTPSGGATSCGTWADIQNFNYGSPKLFPDEYYTKRQVDQKLAVAGISGPITSSGLTTASGVLLGRTSIGTGPIETILAGSHMTLASGILDATPVQTGGTGSELQARLDANNLQALPFSSISGTNLTLGGNLTLTSGNITLSAGSFIGIGSSITALNASNLASGTVPLARLSGITNTEIAAAAGIVDTKLATISTAGKVSDSALSSNVPLKNATNIFTATQTINPSTSPTDALLLAMTPPVGNGTLDSHKLVLQGAGRVTGTPHTADWRVFVGVEDGSGISSFHLQNRKDSNTFTDMLRIDDSGSLSVTGTIAAGVVGANSLTLQGDGLGNTMLVLAPTATTLLSESYFVYLQNTTQTLGANYALQRFIRLEKPTITASSPHTITDTATLSIEGAPVATGSATLTNSYALWVRAGDSRFESNVRIQGTLIVGSTVNTGLTGLIKSPTGTTLAAAVSGTDYVAPTTITSSGLTMNTGKLLGRSTASSGAVEEITVGTGLTLSAGTLTATGGGGNVTGPGSSVDNDIVRFDGTTGLLVQDSGASIDDTGKITSKALTVTRAANDYGGSGQGNPFSIDATFNSAGTSPLNGFTAHFPSVNAGNATGLRMTYDFTGSGNGGIIRGISSQLTHGGSAAISEFRGFESQMVSSGAGGVTTLSAFKGTITNSVGPITTLYGVRLDGWSNTGGGTVSTSYGLYMDSSIDLGTTKYAIYSTSNAPSVINNTLSLAGATPGTNTTALNLSNTSVDGGVYNIGLNIDWTFTATPSFFSLSRLYATTSTDLSGTSTILDASFTYSGTTSAILRGLASNIAYSGVNTVSNALPLAGIITNSSTGTITTARGVSGAITNSGGGTVTTGVAGRLNITNSSGTIGTAKGLEIAGWSNSGTITTSYGIYMDTSIDVGTTKWALYSLSASPSLLTGDLTVSGLLKAGSGPTTLTNASGTILDSALSSNVPLLGSVNTYTNTSNWLITLSSTNAIYIQATAASTGTTRDSNPFVISCTSDDGDAHVVDWRQVASCLTTDGTSNQWSLQSRLQPSSFITRLSVNNLGTITVPGVIIAGSGGTTLTDSAGKILSNALNTVALAQGGTGSSLSDPGANRLWGWDDTDNTIGFWTIGTGLSYDHTTHTLTATATGGGITWTEVTGTTQTMAVDNGYIANNAAQVVFTLPATAAVGKVVRVSGKGAGGWKIAQNASGQIHFGSSDTTSGTGGYLASTQQRDAVELVCVVANNEWNVVSSIGNITIN